MGNDLNKMNLIFNEEYFALYLSVFHFPTAFQLQRKESYSEIKE